MSKKKISDRNSPAELERIASELRIALGVEHQQNFDILNAVSNNLSAIFPGFEFVVKPNSEMPGIEAFATANPPKITLSEDTEQGLKRCDPHFRYTLAHEVSHLMLHAKFIESGDRQLNRNAIRDKQSKWEDKLETEANKLAAAILIPRRFAEHYKSPVALSEATGVSLVVAEIRMDDLGVLPKKKSRLVQEGFKALLADLLNPSAGSPPNCHPDRRSITSDQELTLDKAKTNPDRSYIWFKAYGWR